MNYKTKSKNNTNNMKSLAIFQESMNDTLLSIGTTLYNEILQDLVDNDTIGQFFTAEDEDHVEDFCFLWDENTPNPTCTLQGANGTYQRQGQDFVDSRPPRRPGH